MTSNIFNKIYKHPIVFISFLLLLANFFFIVNDNIYWDDWVWVGTSLQEYMSYNRMLGNFWLNGLHFYFIYNIPVICARLIYLVYIWVSIIFLYKILNSKLSNEMALEITLLYAILPVVSIRYSFCIIHYYLSIMLFFIASYFYISNYSNSKKFFAVPLYFLSFQMQSLLVFYALPFVMAFFWNEEKDKISINNIFSYFKHNIVFLLLPFVFFVVHKVFYPISGVYAEDGYNTFSFGAILRFPKYFFQTLKDLCNHIFLLDIGLKLFFVLCLIVVIFMFIKRKYFQLVFLAGLFTVAIFPYVAVGKIGSYNSIQDSRHFILLILPLSVLIVYTINYLIKDEYRNIVYLLLVCSFLSISIQEGKQFFYDKIIQDSIIINMSENEKIRDNHVFEVEESPCEIGVFCNNLDSYTLFGTFWKAFDSQDHIGYNSKVNDISELDFFYKIKDKLSYKIKDVDSITPTHKIYISVDERMITEKLYLFVWLNLFNKNLYNQLVRNATQIEVSHK